MKNQPRQHISNKYNTCTLVTSPVYIESKTWVSIRKCIWTLVLLNPDIPCLCKQWRCRSSESSEEAKWSRSALFVIQYVNLYQQHYQVIWLAENWKWVWHLNLAWQGLRRLDTVGRFSSIRYNGDNFCDFLFAFLQTQPLRKRDWL